MKKFSLLFPILTSIIAGLLISIIVFAWTNPTANPPSGGGALYYYNGNVGIGTTAPGEKLDISGDNNQIYLTTTGTYSSIYPQTSSGTNTGALYWNNTGDTWLEGRTAAGQIRFGTGGTQQERMRITSTGNVGIGTTAPVYKLDVAGQIRSSSGGFVFPDGTTQTSAAGIGTFFESSEIAIVASALNSVSHGLGTTPKLSKIVLRNKTSDCGWSVNDEIDISSLDHAPSVSLATPYVNSTYIGWRAPQAGYFYVYDKNTGAGCAITYANWVLVFRAWK